MGIEKFYGSISKNKITKKGILIEEGKIQANYFYVDFNSILYKIIPEIEKELNMILYDSIIGDNVSVDIQEKWDHDYSQENIHKQILIRVKNYLFYIIDTFINFRNLETIYISFDGIPQMNKVIEQKRRRYMSFIESVINKKIFNKFKSTLPESRIKFEEDKKSINKTNMLSGIGFMKKIYKYLISKDVRKEFRLKYKALKRYVVSSIFVFGEGEKKIMDDINQKALEGKYVIFSPDADIIILSMLMKNSFIQKNIYTVFRVIRYAQETKQYAYIDINLIIKNILFFVQDHLKIKTRIDKNKVLNDLVFIFTFAFGNDFVPHIQSLDVMKDIDTVILAYCKSFDVDNYLIYNDGTYKMNYAALINIFGQLNKIESKLLQETYMETTYMNYFDIKKLFNGYFLIMQLEKYCSMANEIYTNIRNDTFDKSKYDIDMLEQFLLIEGDKMYGNLDHLIDRIKKDNYYRPKLQFEKKTTKISGRKREMLKGDLPHPRMALTKYDENKFLFERKSGIYADMLNIKPNTIGEVKIEIKEKLYNLVITPIPDDLDQIYFGTDKNKIIKKYIKGLAWVFNYYYNEKVEKVPIWFYKSDIAPSIGGIFRFLKKNKKNIDTYFKTSMADKNLVDKKDYFTSIEHYLYVTPVNVQGKLPDKYSNYETLRSNATLFPDLEKIADDIWQGKNVIDCSYATYLSKCKLLTVKNLTFKNYIKILLPLRTEEQIKNIIDAKDNEYVYLKKKQVEK